MVSTPEPKGAGHEAARLGAGALEALRAGIDPWLIPTLVSLGLAALTALILLIAIIGYNIFGDPHEKRRAP